jgi:hypothetical protein
LQLISDLLIVLQVFNLRSCFSYIVYLLTLDNLFLLLYLLNLFSIVVFSQNRLFTPPSSRCPRSYTGGGRLGSEARAMSEELEDETMVVHIGV